METGVRKTIAGSPVVYWVYGEENAESIVFLSAAFADHTMFEKQAAYFQKTYKVIVPDLLGHGESLNAQKGDSMECMAGWLKEILEAEQSQKAHFIGVSLGAVLAQDFANKYPEMMTSLACFGGYNVNRFDTKMQSENGLGQMLMMCKALFSVKWFAKSNMKISAYTKEGQETFYKMNLKFPKKSFLYLASLSKMVNKYPPVARKYPLLIGCGEYDIPMELKAVDMWQEDEPDCKKVIFQNAGHLVNLDAPQEFCEELEKVIKDSHAVQKENSW